MQTLHDTRSGLTHAQATSTGTANVQTVTPPAGAIACIICVETTSARVTFEGTAPDATHGVVYPATQNPIYLPFAKTIKFVSTAAANSIVDVAWLF